MGRRIAFALLAVCVLAPTASAQAVFDCLHKQYTPFMDAADPLAFPMKVHALADSPYKFWRGSKEMYYAWCLANTQDWLADKDAWIASHGDIHFGNIGSYPAGRFGELSFGLVDFDESCRTPVQLELMQGLITLELTARHNRLTLTDAQRLELNQALIDAYRHGLTANKPAGELLAAEPSVKKLLKDAGRSYPKHELGKATTDGRFVAAIRTKDGQIKDLYRPAMARADEFAAGIEQAIAHSPELAEAFGFHDRSAIRKSIKDAALRTRAGSSGSQGLKKYVILLERPLKGQDHDLVLYLKQEIPSAAERAGVSPADSRSPGERVARAAAAMTDPAPLYSSWCNLGAESYWVSFKEPWSEELDPDDLDTFETLQSAARIWGVVAGASHRREPHAAGLAAKLTPAEVALLVGRSTAYVKQLDADFADFTRDPRVATYRKIAAETLAGHGRQSP